MPEKEKQHSLSTTTCFFVTQLSAHACSTTNICWLAFVPVALSCIYTRCQSAHVTARALLHTARSSMRILTYPGQAAHPDCSARKQCLFLEPEARICVAEQRSTSGYA